MKLVVLGSGSAGNAAVVASGRGCLLVDAGLSARQLCRRLEMVGIGPDDLDGILLSHEHSDHARGLEVFLRKHRVPVYATALTREALGVRCGSGVEWRLFRRGEEFQAGGMAVNSFAVPHDAVDPVGFVCGENGTRIGLATDFGHVTTLVRDGLRGVRALLVESNYDQRLLEADRRRPWSIKQRISSRHGHLSNVQSVQLVAELAGHGLEAVVFGHLSRDCNCPRAVAEAMTGCARNGLAVHVASQAEPTPWVEIV